MKRTISLTVFPVGTSSDPKSEITQIPQDVFDRIVSLYPEGRQRRSFYMSLLADDGRAIAVRKALADAGYIERWAKFGPSGGRYVAVKCVDEYEAGDFGRSEWYEVFPVNMLSDYPSRNAQGLLRNLGDWDYPLTEEERKALLSKKIDEPQKKIPKWAANGLATVGGSSAILMGVGLAKAIEASGFVVPSKPTESSGILEWSPRLVFPKLSTRCQFCDPKGNVIAPDADRTCGFLVDGCVQSPTLKYDRDSMAGITGAGGIDDVAKTYERFGNTSEVADPALVVSKNLAAWLIARDKKLRWKPVEIG
jgi:hypothetical protein